MSKAGLARALRILAVSAAAGAFGCGDEGPVSYAVILEGAPQNLGGLILSLETSTHTVVSVPSGTTIPALLDGAGTRRVIFLAPALSASMAHITFEARPAVEPIVVVLEAAANQAGGYAPIPVSSVRVRVQEMSEGR